MNIIVKQYDLYRYFELNRLCKAYQNNLDYYNVNGNWERYVNAIKGIAEETGMHQTHLVNETTADLKLMFSIHDELIEEFIRMFYAELYKDIATLNPTETIQFLQNKLTEYEPI